jgi:hypothetical protein
MDASRREPCPVRKAHFLDRLPVPSHVRLCRSTTSRCCTSYACQTRRNSESIGQKADLQQPPAEPMTKGRRLRIARCRFLPLTFEVVQLSRRSFRYTADRVSEVDVH